MSPLATTLRAAVPAVALALSACSSGASPAAPGSVSVSVDPSAPSVAPRGTVAFTASVTGAASAAVTWSVTETGGGAVDATGLYTAPATEGTFHVVATSAADPSKRGSAAVSVVAPAPGGTGKWVTGYYAHWLRGDYPISKIDWSALTHVTVANVSLDADGSLWNPRPDGWDTNDWACEIVDAAHAHGKKAILMVGGAGSASDFQAVTRSATARARFVREVVAWALDPAQGGCGFDGLDVDWEPLDLWSYGTEGDGPYVVQLVKDLRAAWPGLIVTFAAGWGDGDPWFGKNHALFDQINLMTYAISGDWGGWLSWHHAALYGDDPADHPSSVSASVRWMREGGVPASKIGIGIGFYGTVWSGGSPPVTGPLQRVSSGVFCDRDSDNVNTYAYIMKSYYTPGAYRWDDVAKMGYLTYPSGYGPAKATWISYEDARSIQAKGDFVKAEGLGGTIIWLIQHGCTNSTTGENPPLAAVKAAFLQ